MKLKLKDEIHKGKLITFCGLDGCGKTTLIKMLEKYLKNRGITPVITKQPTDAVRQSQIFRTYMDNPDHSAYDYRALSLFAASDRVQHTNKFIVPMLDKGEVVISDRYFYSCLANLRARGYLEDTWIYEIAKHMQKPDISFFIDIDVETAVNRVRSRESEKNRYIDIALQYRLRQQYLKIAEDVGGIVISSDKEADACFREVLSHTEGLIFQNV